MKLKLSDQVSIEFSEPNELIELMTEDDKLHFFQSLSCHDSVLENVAEQIINGVTEFGYHGSKGGVKAEPSASLDKAIRDVCLSIGSIQTKEIKRLQRELRRLEGENAKMLKVIWG